MKRCFIYLCILTFVLTSFGFSTEDLNYKLGAKVTNLSLKDLNGKEFDLEEILSRDDVKGLVLVFISVKCPASAFNDSRYIQHASKFKEDGILFAGISSNYDDSIEDLKEHAEQNKYNFPVLKDFNNVAADRFSAKSTPTAYLIDKKGLLRYKGRIDDSLKDPKKITETTLLNVVEEFLAGKELSVIQTRSGG